MDRSSDFIVMVMMMMMMMMLMLLVKILDKPKVDSDDPTWPGEEITVNYLSFTPAMQLATGSLLLRPFFSPKGRCDKEPDGNISSI